MFDEQDATFTDEDDNTPFYLRVPDPAAQTETDALANVEADELRARVAALPTIDAAVIEWRYGLNGGEQLSVQEVARRLGGISKSTAHAIERRGLRVLREAYQAAA